MDNRKNKLFDILLFLSLPLTLPLFVMFALFNLAWIAEAAQR